MPNMDLELAAQGAVTPEWGWFDVKKLEGQPTSQYIQGIRVSGTTQVTLQFQGAVIGNDGSKEFHTLASFNVAGTVGAEEMLRRTDIIPGMAYRVRYETGSTNRIRVLVTMGDGGNP